MVSPLPILPSLPGLTYPRKRTATWRTDIEESFSGLEASYPTRSLPRWAYEIPISVLRTSTALPEWQQLASFFNSLYGSNGLFQYDDPLDDAVSAQPFGETDGVTQAYQLVRTGPPGGGTFTEPVYAPSTITSLTVGGSTLAYTVGDTGIISFSTVPAASQQLLWSGKFLWVCRFDGDQMEFVQDFYNLYSVSALKFQSMLF